MATSDPEWARARILSHDRRPSGPGRICLLWPAWTYRVTAPVLEKRDLDLFERVILALCQAGVRRPDRLGEHVELDAQLCAHLLDTAVKSGHLNARHELTEQGRQALRAGTSIHTAQWQVCYVFEDPFTGELWPRVVESLREAFVIRSTPDGAEVELGTMGRSDRAQARRVLPPLRPAQRPNAARIVETAAIDRATRRVFQVRQFEQRNGLDAADVPADLIGARGAGLLPDVAELNRVAFLDDPEPVFLLGFLEAGGGTRAETAEAWSAYDPFGLGTSEMFQSLIYRFGREDGFVDEEIRVRNAADLATARERRRDADDQLRVLLEQQLVHDFGQQLRADNDAFDLMLELELAAESGPRAEVLERVVHNASRLFEILFRRMVMAYPLNPQTFQTFQRSRPLRRAMLEQAAQQIGFHQAATLFADVKDHELDSTYDDPSRGFLKATCALSLLAAQEYADHPLRALAQEQPDLPAALTVLNGLRNRASHAGRDAPNADDTQWLRDVAASATRALIRLPEPRTERIQL